MKTIHEHRKESLTIWTIPDDLYPVIERGLTSASAGRILARLIGKGQRHTVSVQSIVNILEEAWPEQAARITSRTLPKETTLAGDSPSFVYVEETA